MARKYKRIEEDVAKGTVEQTITEDTVSRYGPKMTKKRLLNIFQKRYDEAMDKVDEVEAAGIPMEATVTVDWRKNRDGEYDPRASMTYTYVGRDGKNRKKTVQSDRVKGGNIDKRTIAIADVLNQSPEFSRLIYDARENGKDAGQGVSLSRGRVDLPIYEGRAGDGAQERSLRKLGYDIDTVSMTDTQEVIAIRRRTDSRNNGSANRKAKAKAPAKRGSPQRNPTASRGRH